MTIAEAAAEALRQHGSPMNVDEIHDAIRDRGLYTFKATEARSVLRTQLRRHCEGLAPGASSSRKLFKCESDGRYSLTGG